MHIEYIDLTAEEYRSYFEDNHNDCISIHFSDTTIEIYKSDFNKLIKDIIKKEEKTIIKNLLSNIQEKNNEE